MVVVLLGPSGPHFELTGAVGVLILRSSVVTGNVMVGLFGSAATQSSGAVIHPGRSPPLARIFSMLSVKITLVMRQPWR